MRISPRQMPKTKWSQAYSMTTVKMLSLRQVSRGRRGRSSSYTTPSPIPSSQAAASCPAAAAAAVT